MSNTLLSRVPRSAMGPELGGIWDTLNALTNEPSFVEAFASAPELLNFVMNDFYGNIFFRGRVENRYKQLLRLRLSVGHGCRTCNLQNVPGSLDAGITREQVAAIDDHLDGPFSAAEHAVLRYADQMLLTSTDGIMDAELYQALREHFDDAQICELGVCMAVIGGMAKLSFVLDLVEKEPYCAFGNSSNAGADKSATAGEVSS